MAKELETVDLDAVEILSTGGPVKAVGSPPEGEYWTGDHLRDMVDAAAELGDELKAPARIGHRRMGETQDGALRVSPAVGWLENQRLSEDGSKIIADIKRVPAKFGDLVKTGAFRTRSSELSRITSQKTGKTYDYVVSGLAWLGDKLPAVQTLDDVVALYEAEDLSGPAADVRVIVMHQTAEKIVWDPSSSLQTLRDSLQRELNPGGMEGSNAFYVNDVSADGKALVCRGYGTEEAWVVPFTTAADGAVTVAASSDWIPAEQTWVATARANELAATGGNRRPADTRTEMADDHKFTDEQRRAFQEATGLEEEKVTDETMAAAGVKPETEEDDGEVAERNNELADRVQSAEERAEKAEKKADEANETLRLNERSHQVERVVREGKEPPARKAEIETLYDKLGHEDFLKHYESARVDETLVREFGSDEEGTDEQTDEQKRALESELAEVFPGYEPRKVEATA